MNIKKTFFQNSARLPVIILCFTIVFMSFSSYCTAESADSIQTVSKNDISAESAVLIDGSCGKVLFEKNAYARLPMASTTKIMTALVAIESCPLDKVVKITKEAVGIEGSSIYLYEGECLTMENLLYAILLESANDAAVAIAIEVGGSIEDFADMMNEKAKSIGLENTSFTNPHGLDNENHYTTAYDLSIITMTAMASPVFTQIVSTVKKTIPQNDTEGVRLLINHNKMLRLYDSAIGVKTGFTKRSGRCLVSAAERDGIKLIAVTLNAPNDWTDHSTMLDYGFNNYEYVELCAKGGFSEPLHLISGVDTYVMMSNTAELYATLPVQHGEISCTIELPRFTYAPIEEGEIVGRLVYRCDGNIIGQCDIAAMYDVEVINYKFNFFKWLKAFFQK